MPCTRALAADRQSKQLGLECKGSRAGTGPSEIGCYFRSGLGHACSLWPTFFSPCQVVRWRHLPPLRILRFLFLPHHCCPHSSARTHLLLWSHAAFQPQCGFTNLLLSFCVWSTPNFARVELLSSCSDCLIAKGAPNSPGL